MATLIACAVNKPFKYVFAKNIDAKERERITIDCNKGLYFYRVNCSGCHSKYVKKREIIPDFTLDQVADYNFRVLNKMHKDSVSQRILSEDDLSYIIVFFAHKPANDTATKRH